MGWFELWKQDKMGILDCMVRNMCADLLAGYDYFGASITEQRRDIELYKADMEARLTKFTGMTGEHVNKWCYYDMKRRGAI